MVAQENGGSFKALKLHTWKFCSAPYFAQIFVQNRSKRPHDLSEAVLHRSVQKRHDSSRNEKIMNGGPVIGSELQQVLSFGASVELFVKLVRNNPMLS